MRPSPLPASAPRRPILERTLSALILILALGEPAWAGAPAPPTVQLPAGEPVELWRAPLSLAGLSPGDGRPGVEILAQGDRWLILAWDDAGVARAAEVARPSTPRAREDLAMLAASLLRQVSAPPVTAQSLPVASLPPPPPPPPRPEPSRAPPAVVRADPAPVAEPAPAVPPPPEAPAAPAPAAPAPEAPAPPPPPPELAPAPAPAPPARPSLRLSVGARALANIRPSQSATGGVVVALDARQDPLWVELGLFGLFPSELAPLDDSNALGLRGLDSGVGWTSGLGPVEYGFGGGISALRYQFQEAGYAAQTAWGPAVHGDARLGLPLPGPWVLDLGGRVGLDLRKLTFADPDGDDPELSRLWIWPTLGARWAPP